MYNVTCPLSCIIYSYIIYSKYHIIYHISYIMSFIIYSIYITYSSITNWIYNVISCIKYNVVCYTSYLIYNISYEISYVVHVILYIMYATCKYSHIYYTQYQFYIYIHNIIHCKTTCSCCGVFHGTYQEYQLAQQRLLSCSSSQWANFFPGVPQCLSLIGPCLQPKV